MQYTKKTFHVLLGSDAYRANYDAVFGKKDEPSDEAPKDEQAKESK